MTRSQSSDDLKRARAQAQAYFAALPPLPRRALKAVRNAIRAAVPGVVEGFSYGIPAFRLDGKRLVWCAAWKHHVSIYPMTATMKRVYARELEGYEVEKGTIRFSLDEPIPSGLIKKLVNSRVAELRQKKTT